MTKGLLRLLAVPLVLAAVSAGAQTTNFSLGLGYQWLNVTGNEDMYRTQLDEKAGFTLQDFSLTYVDGPGSTAPADRVRVNAAGFGGSPQGRLFVEASMSGVYTARLQYRRAKHFSALPGFANPFLAKGIVPGQHTTDRTTDTIDLDVEILPGHVVTPIVGYRWYRSTGPSTTTIHFGQDEFRLNSDFRETAQDFQAGAAFRVGTFAATILQGWRRFDESGSAALVPGGGSGNNTAPVLGRDITAGSYGRSSASSATFPFTTGYLSGRIGDRIRVTGSYVKTGFKSENSETEDASGSFASFKLSRFFQGLATDVVSGAKAPDWRGEARIDTELIDGLDLSVGYTQRHRRLDGWATIQALYTGTVNFAGADGKDVGTLINTSNVMDREEKQVEARLGYRNLGPVQIWGSVAKADQTLTVTPDAAEIVVPGGQGGSFDRSVKRYAAGANLGIGSFKLAIDWRKDDADRAVVRIDTLNQTKTRAQVQWSPWKVLRIAGSAEELKGDNPTAGIGSDFTAKQYALDVDVTPIDAVTVRLGYSTFKSDSSVLVRQPEDFQTASSLYREDGRSSEAGFDLRLSEKVRIGAGFSRFDNKGDVVLKLDRTYAKAEVDFTAKVGVTVVYDVRKYSEDALSLASYDAKRYGFFLRWRQ